MVRWSDGQWSDGRMEVGFQWHGAQFIRCNVPNHLLTVVGHWSCKGQLPHCALPLVIIANCWSMVNWSCGVRVRGVSRPRGCWGHRSIALPAPCLCPRPTHKQTNKYKYKIQLFLAISKESLLGVTEKIFPVLVRWSFRQGSV